ncbi:MAG: DUF1579 domain-containing protein [Synechococcales bacterium]|nr:DUF1579 domain-containing protein [Synechococcales bacterium]
MESTPTQLESTMQAQTQKEHDWLQKLVGEWAYETEARMGPNQPPERATGVERVRSLNGLWIVAEGRGEMLGGCPATTIMTLGYDPQKQRYVGTWIGSMMTYLWLYDGEMDTAKQVLTLSSEGPAMNGQGKMAQYRDVITIQSDDCRVLTSHLLGDDGQWHQFMTAHYRRQ